MVEVSIHNYLYILMTALVRQVKLYNQECTVLPLKVGIGLMTQHYNALGVQS